MENTKTDMRGFRILMWLVIAVCAAAIVASTLSLGTMGQVYGLAPGFGDIVTYLFQIHGFLAFFLGWWCVSFLFAHEKREAIAKACSWAVLVLMLLHIAPFFTDTVFYLSTVTFSAGLNYFSAYVPSLMAVITYVALLSNWTETDHRRTHRISLLCGLIAVFMCIVYLAQVFSLMSLTSTLHDNAQLWGLVFGNVAITLSIIVVFALTQSKRSYERLLYDMTDDEAFAYEIVAERVDAASQQIEMEVERELAVDAEQEALIDAIGIDEFVTEGQEAAHEEPKSNPLLERWTLSEEIGEESDPLDELWRPPDTPVITNSETDVRDEPVPQRGRFIPANENRPGTRLPRRDQHRAGDDR